MTHPGNSQWNTAGPWAAAAQTAPHWSHQQPYGHDDPTTFVQRAPARGPGSMRTKLVVGLAAVALGISGGAAWAGLAASPASAHEVRLEPTSFAGDSPFLAPVGQDKSDVTAPAGTGGEFTGDTPGLYAEGDDPSCDTQALVSGLQADNVKSTAWANAMGIEPAGIPNFVNSLSPVLLRSDTAVTNYAFRAGTFAPAQTVLQAGTSVLINSYGEPTVKCFSGNPLTKPVEYDAMKVEFVGKPWTNFAPERSTFIEPTTIVIKKHVFIDYEDHTPHEKPGKPDTKEHPGPNPEHKPEHKPTPDPAKEMAAMEAKKMAETATKDATDKRATADDKAIEARIFETEARNLETARDAKLAEVVKLREAANAEPDLAKREILLAQARTAADQLTTATKDAETARTMATEKANQAKFSDAAARDAEAVSKIAMENAAKAKAEADKAAGRTADQKLVADEGTGTDGTEQNTDLQANGEPVTDPQTATTANGTTDGTTGATGATGATTDGTTELPAGTPPTDTTGADGATNNGAGDEGTAGTTNGTGGEGTTGTDPAAGTEVPGTAGTTDTTGTGPAGPAAGPFMQTGPPAGPAEAPNGPGNTGVAGGTPGAGAVPQIDGPQSGG